MYLSYCIKKSRESDSTALVDLVICAARGTLVQPVKHLQVRVTKLDLSVGNYPRMSQHVRNNLILK